ncbi:MAG: 30S ribosomal protein S8, partial [Chloroflexi bacterium]|nr:30S ribosomal protein S8 [Chloroflexota bacterium]
LTRIRNAVMARHETVQVPASRVKIALVKILQEEGFLRSFEVLQEGPQKTLRLQPTFVGRREPVIHGIRRISRPGLRIYVKNREMPTVFGGLGVAIVSTSRGIMVAHEARRRRLGGEIICYVW